MYLIDKGKNNMSKITERKFSDLGLRERDHLQEWVSKNPNCLGEELLIIQKEFSGFDDTNERLDLLALDKEGNLVIIENKLDDTGRDVLWQALKYASYCSSLTKKQIIEIFQEYLNKLRSNENAEASLVEFFEVPDLEEIELNKDQSQRIFFVAAKFRKEVTSTALWLMDYNVRIKCFKVTSYQLDDSLLLNFEQIIPMKDSEDYMIRMAEKNQEILVTREKIREREKINKEFWTKFLDQANASTNLYQNINPSKDSWLWKSAGISRFRYSLVISKTYARVEFYINTPSKEKNKEAYDVLLEDKDQIESEIGCRLIWERMDNKKASRIKLEISNISINNEENWDEMISFLIDNIIKFEKVFSKKIPVLKKIS